MKKNVVGTLIVLSNMAVYAATLGWVPSDPFVWRNGDTNWKTGGTGGTPGAAWDNSNNDVADFGGGKVNVELGSDIAASRIVKNWWHATSVFDLKSYALTLSGTGNQLQFNKANGTLTMLNGSLVFGSASQFSVGHSGGTVTIQSPISGSTNVLVKTGPGTLSLEGVGNVFGGTTVNEGTMRVAAGSSLGVSNVTVNSGGTLHLQTSTAIHDGADLVLSATDTALSLDFTGAEVVNGMSINGSDVPSGTYTATDLTGLLFGGVFSGDGAIEVSSGEQVASAVTNYINSASGSDTNDGLSPETAWATLERASETNIVWNPGDAILLARGQTHSGQLLLNAQGAELRPIRIGAYGDTNAANPVIDGSSVSNAITLTFPRDIVVQDVAFTGGGIKAQSFWATGTSTYQRVRFKDLSFTNIAGTAIAMSTSATNLSATVFSDVVIEGCVIDTVSEAGITVNKWDIDGSYFHEGIVISNNTISNCGGSGIQVGKLGDNSVMVDNTVNNTGGSWLWGSKNVRVEGNTFAGSTGSTDATGIWLDIGNTGCVIQRNLSINNEGGFVEILGNSSNNVYRYNISINDGAREAGVNGATQDGRIFWLGGYTGAGTAPVGAYNNYLYNNTVYTRSDMVARYQADQTTSGALIANNIIYVEGAAETFSSSAENVLFKHNLVYNNKIPTTPFIASNTIEADPSFANVGGLTALDYVPANGSAIIDAGMVISNLINDSMGLVGGFEVFDYLGNPVLGEPDVGAFELSRDQFLVGWHTFSTANGNTNATGFELPDYLVEGVGATMGTNVAVGGGFRRVDGQDGGLSYGAEWVGYTNVNATVSNSLALATWNQEVRALDFAITNNSGKLMTISSIHFDATMWYGDTNEFATVTLSHLSDASDLDDLPVEDYAIMASKTINFGWNDLNTVNAELGEAMDRTLAPGEVAAFRIGLKTPLSGVGTALRLDNIGVGGYISVVSPLEGYEAWASIYGVDLSDLSADYDDDGWNNLLEYALGGDPTNSLVVGHTPAHGKTGNAMEYRFMKRVGDTNLTYQLETNSDLVYGSWSNAGYTVEGTAAADGLFSEVTNSIPMTAPKMFMRLKIERN